MNAFAESAAEKDFHPDSRQAWLRLAATILVSTIGGVGMWSVVVALPPVQAEFAVPRSEASLPFTLAMVGFAVGGVFMGRLFDRTGILGPLALGSVALSVGYFGAAGEMDTCIVLRASVVKDGRMHVQAGAGVVYDSLPDYEDRECANKARALFRAAEEAVRFATSAKRGQ